MITRARRTGALFIAAAMALTLPAAGGGLAAAAAQPAWVPLGPAGGPVQAVAFAPSQPEIVYAGSAFSGVFRSGDGGRGWTAANAGLDSAGVLALAVSPDDPSVVYACVQTAPRGPAVAIAIAASFDGGDSWQDATPAAGSHAYSFALDPHDSSLLYAATDAGLFRTHFGQTNWTRLARFATQSVAVDPTSSSTLYVSGSRGLLKSTDGGTTWAATPGNPDSGSLVAPINLIFDPTRPETLYALIFDAPFVVRTTDGGRSWVSSGLPTAPGTLARAISLAISPAGNLYLTGVHGGPRFFRSTDHGATWQQPDGGGPPDNLIYDLAVAPATGAGGAGESLLAVGDIGVWSSADSGTAWRPSSLGLQAQNVDSLAVAADGTLFAGVTTANGPGNGAGIFRGTNHGLRMRRLSGESERVFGQVVADPRQPGTVYAGNGAVIGQKSTDGGLSWTRVSFPFGNLVIDPTRSATLYVTTFPVSIIDVGCQVWKSVDAGTHWTCIEPAFLTGFFQLIVDPRRPATLYGLDPVFGDALVRRSDDGGTTWEIATAGLGAVDSATAMAIDPRSSTLYLATPQGLFRSTNRARGWHLLSTALPQGTDLLIADGSTALLFAGAAGRGVFSSADGGVTWTEVGSGLPASIFSGLFALDPVLPLTLYAATAGQGLLRLDLTP
jgi:hypothetical protein